jgi:hypothetical protein
MMRNEKDFKDKKFEPKIHAEVAGAMRMTRNQEDFLKILNGKGIDVVFRENETGRIYGVTFIDHNNREVYNGSRLGKEFSANVFQRLFNELSAAPQFPKQAEEGMTAKTSHSGSFPSSFFDLENAIEEIFGIFDFSQNVPDPEDEALARRRKKKKKKKRGLSL